MVVLEKKIDNYTYITYLAPHTGIILENKVSDDGQFNITTQLVDYTSNSALPQSTDTEVVASDMRVLTQEEAIKYAHDHPELVEQFRSVIEDGYGEFHNFTDEQLAALPEDAYFNTLVLHKTSMPTGGDPSTTAHLLSYLYPEILGTFTGPEPKAESVFDNPIDLIDIDGVLEELQKPNALNESLSYNEAQAIVDQIIANILENHHNYTPNNRGAFNNALQDYLPGSFSTGQTLAIPDFFYAYIDSLNAAHSSTVPATNTNADYSVDMSELNGRHIFESFQPNFKQIEIDFSTGQLSYQGSVANDPGLYNVRVENNEVRNINVAHFDEASSRNVSAVTNLIIQGETAHYRLGTNAAYLFYNSDEGISLALPDLKNELQNVDQQTWIEYQMVE